MVVNRTKNTLAETGSAVDAVSATLGAAAEYIETSTATDAVSATLIALAVVEETGEASEFLDAVVAALTVLRTAEREAFCRLVASRDIEAVIAALRSARFVVQTSARSAEAGTVVTRAVRFTFGVWRDVEV